MGNNNINGGVNNDSLAKLKTIIADGQVKADELKGLTSAEKDALQKYLQGEGKDLPKDGEIVYLKEPVAQNDNRSNGSILFNAIAGAVGKVAAGLLALTPLGLASCSKGDVYEFGGTDIDSKPTVNVTLKFDSQSIVNAVNNLEKTIKELAEDKDKKDDANWKTLIDLVNKTLTTINNLKAQINAAHTVQQDLLANILTKMNTILANMTAANTNTEEMIKLLKGLAENVVSLNDKQAEFFTNVIGKIDKLDENAQNGLNKIISNQEILKGLSAEICAKLDTLTQKYDDMSAVQKEAYANILAAIGNINKGSDLSNVEALLNKILANVVESVNNQEEMAAADSAFYEAILNKLDGMDKAQAGALEDLLAAIKENTNVAQGTYVVANKILEAMDKLGDKADEAINVLKNLAVGGSEFNAEDMKAFITATVQGMMDAFKAQHKEALDRGDANTKAILDKLQEILDKIPEGCNCDDSEIIGKLEIIIDNLEKDTIDDSTHEGIIGDLGGLFG